MDNKIKTENLKQIKNKLNNLSYKYEIFKDELESLKQEPDSKEKETEINMINAKLVKIKQEYKQLRTVLVTNAKHYENISVSDINKSIQKAETDEEQDALFEEKARMKAYKKDKKYVEMVKNTEIENYEEKYTAFVEASSKLKRKTWKNVAIGAAVVVGLSSVSFGAYKGLRKLSGYLNDNNSYESMSEDTTQATTEATTVEVQTEEETTEDIRVRLNGLSDDNLEKHGIDSNKMNASQNGGATSSGAGASSTGVVKETTEAQDPHVDTNNSTSNNSTSNTNKIIKKEIIPEKVTTEEPKPVDYPTTEQKQDNTNNKTKNPSNNTNKNTKQKEKVTITYESDPAPDLVLPEEETTEKKTESTTESTTEPKPVIPEEEKEQIIIIDEEESPELYDGDEVDEGNDYSLNNAPYIYTYKYNANI